MSIPTAKNINAARCIFQKAEGWSYARSILSKYFQDHKSDTDIVTIAIKAILINQLYFTNVREILPLARHLHEKREIHARILKGDVKAVDEIARTTKNFRSFASKYAHFHNKDAFPIFDRYVERALCLLTGKGVGKTYADFHNAISQFKKGLNPQVSWEELDTFLWLYGQKKVLDSNGKATVNKEIKSLYEKQLEMFKLLEPPSATTPTSTPSAV